MQPNKQITLFPALVFYNFFIFVSLVISYLSKKHPFFLTSSKVIRWEHAAYGLLSGLAVVFISYIITHFFKWAKELESEFKIHLTPLKPPSIFGLSVASSLGEEFLFRGAIQPLLGIYWTSLLFGLFHFPFKKEMIPWSVLAVLMGLLLGFLYQKTGNLAAPMLCHFTINFCNLLILQK